MTENMMKKICAVLSFRAPLFDLLFFKFLFAIFNSRNKMFIKGCCHCLFQFLDRYRLHNIGVCAQF